MEAEQRAAERPLDLEVVRVDLSRRLQAYQTPVTDEIRKLLVDMPEAYDEDECVDQAMGLLGDFAAEQVLVVRGRACSDILRTYPASSDDSPGLESPNQFMKSNGLDGSMRPVLRQAQVNAISDSRDRLITDIEQDEYHEEGGLGVTDEQLRESARNYRTGLYQSIAELSQQVQELMPEMPAPVGGLGWVAMYTVGYRRHSQPTVIDVPESGPERGRLEGVLFGLRTVLTELGQGAAAAAKHVSQEHEPAVASHLEEQLGSSYRELEAEELQSLPAMLRTAYEEAASNGCQYQPKPAPEPETAPEITEEETSQPLSPGPETDGNGVMEETDLGEVENPFPWASGESIRLSVLSNGTSELLLCKAMTPVAEEVSDNLKREVRLSKKLSNLWSRVKQTEISGNAISHNLIRVIKFADFHNLTIRYFAGGGSNSGRVYYARASSEKFPSIAEKAREAGLQEDTPLVIFLAETDKAHQLKIYSGFGVTLAKGVGST